MRIAATLYNDMITGDAPTMKAATTQGFYDQITAFEKILKQAGIPDIVVPMATAQVLHETNGFGSRVSSVDNNFSGIKFINKSYQHATKGSAAPDGGNYAHYATPGEWAIDFKRILSLNTGGRGRPIDATDPETYLLRLQANHYFTDSYSNYAKGFNAWRQKILDAIAWYKKTGEQFASGEKTDYTAKATDYQPTDDIEARLNVAKAWVMDHKLEATVIGVGLLLLLTNRR